MRGLFFTGDSNVEIMDIKKPTPGSGEVILKMKSSGICGSDLKNLRASKSEKDAEGELVVPGHEPVGVVAEIGLNVKGLKVGDRIMMHHYTGCLRCNMCRIGYTQMCSKGTTVYGTGAGGGHQDYMLVPAYTCIKMPDELGFVEAAACSCGTGTAFHAVKRVSPTGLDTVVIFGQGPVGLSATMFAAQMGARVIAIDVVESRLELAKTLGAETVINSTGVNIEEVVREFTDGEGADISLEVTGIPEVRIQALNSVRSWGKVCFIGEGPMDIPIDISDSIIHRQLSVMGSWTFSQSGLSEVARFVVERNSPMDKLITHTFDIERGQEAYDLFVSGNTGKVIFSWEI